MKRWALILSGIFLLIILGHFGTRIFVAVDSKSSGATVIGDIKAWDHPVKKVFMENRISMIKVDLTNDKTYPAFYGLFPEGLRRETVQFYYALIQRVATANAYWDYKLVDVKRNRSIEVECERTTRIIKRITVDGDDRVFDKLLQAKRDKDLNKVFDYLIRKVPEINDFKEFIADYAQKTGEKVELIYRMDDEPDPGHSDPYRRDYYHIFVGEDHETNTVQWNTFLVHKELNAIFVYDNVNKRYSTLKQWRETRQTQ